MRKLLLAAALAALPLVGHAAPPGAASVIWAAQLSPRGYCQLTSLSASTLLSACSGGIPDGATIANVIVESQAVRYRDDGTAPSATVGMPLAVGTDKVFVLNNLGTLRFIEQTSGAKLNVSFY